MSTLKVNDIQPFSGTTITANELIATGSFSGSFDGNITNAVTASYAAGGDGSFSGSFSGSFEGDGSSLTGVSAGAAGSDSQVQFNDAGAIAGNSNLTFAKATGTLTSTTGSHQYFTNGNPNNTMIFDGPKTSIVNNTTLVEVSSSSQIPNTLSANTTYIIRGDVETGRTINVTNPGTAVVGVDKNSSTLCYTGSAELFNVVDENFSLRNITIKTSGSLMEASNIEVGGPYNNNRRKVLDLENVVVRNSNNMMKVTGFELVDLNNCLFWYNTGSQGLQFQSCRHLELSSCEIYNWYDENDTGSFAPSGTRMIEIFPNTGSVNTPVVNINSCIVHPEQGQIGLYIDSGSETLFGTVAANTFIDANGGVLLGGSTYDSSSMLRYDVGLNQGLGDSQTYLYGYQSGTDVQGPNTTYTQVSISNFQTNISSRMSASLEGVVYIGTKPIDVAITINAGLDGVGGNTEEFDIAIYKNTQLISGSERQLSLDTAEVGNINTFALANIVENDLITVYQKSPTNDDFTLFNFSIMIKE